MQSLWQIRLLGDLRVEGAHRILTRFRTEKTGSLLAYLAYHCHRSHPRDALIETIWPEDDLASARHKLRNALSSLRHQLEPPGVPSGAVIVANRTDVQMNPDAIRTDAAQFEMALQAAARAGSSHERTLLLSQAVDLYIGELLPGHYEDWIVPERQRLEEAYLQALHTLIQLLERSRDFRGALDHARRAVSVDPLREEAHRELIRLLNVAGQPSAALQQYHELIRILADHEEAPSRTTRQLAELIEARDLSAETNPRSVAAPNPSGLPQEDGAEPRLSLTPTPHPVGTVTFLLIDYAGYTALGEKAGVPFQAVLSSCHELMHREFRRHSAYEINEAGDSFVVAFAGAGHALTCAVATQRVLAEHPWPPGVAPLQARMALHTGDVELEENGYHDLVLDHASRILMAAHGGQILCSEITAGLLPRARGTKTMLAAAGGQLVDLGIYRLPGVATPERLFQVSDPGMSPSWFPPLKAEPAYTSNLPLQFTRFFGRQAEVAQLRRMLQDRDNGARLVTVTGPGGGGKTRLALATAEGLVESLRGAAWFVPLADLADPGLIVDAVLDALRLPRSPQASPLEQIVDALSLQPALLVLDNFEHLVVEGAAVVWMLLEQMPSLKCLVTSRQRLGLEGEREFPLQPLPVPGNHALEQGELRPERLSLYESVQLFIDRAQAVRPDFQVTNANAAALAALCQRLEGIPLALELAAARVRALTPAQILTHLERRLDFLTSPRRDATPRHRTLRAAIDWSYRLLPPELQRFFQCLSVFRGGWTIEAAEVVCQEPLALDYLTQLQECSLVLAEERAPGVRFRMLETLREFASEQLAIKDEEALTQRHAEYCLTLAEAMKAALTGAREAEWLDRLEAELDNVRAALAGGIERTPRLALELAETLDWFWRMRCHFTEGRAVLERALAHAADAPAPLRGRALLLMGELASDQGDYRQAKEKLEAALPLCRSHGDRTSIARALRALGYIAWAQGDYLQARGWHEQSVQIWEELGNLTELAWNLLQLATTVSFLGDWTLTQTLTERSLSLHRQLGNQSGIAGVLHHLSIRAMNSKQFATARALSEESLTIMRSIGDDLSRRFGLLHLGHVAYHQGQYAEARMLLQESMDLCRRMGSKRLIVECLCCLAKVDSAEGEWETAARRFGVAKALQDAIGFAYWLKYDDHLRILRERLGDATFSAAWAAGQRLTWQQAAEEALGEPRKP